MAQTIAFRPGRRTLARTLANIETITTGELLDLHERHFAPLDPLGKRRIADAAILRGWDREWVAEEGLAA
jgi:hypothetical protein